MQRLSIVASLFVGLLISTAVAPQACAQTEQDSKGKTPDAVVHVRDMFCQNCVRTMKRALEKLDAVEKAGVQLEEQRALLTLKEDQTVTEDALREAVEGAGYMFRKVVFLEKEEKGAAEAATAVQMEGGVQVVSITASDRGYEPMRIQLQKGVPTRLVFTRTTKSHCMKQVQIPAFGVEKVALPMKEPIALEFTPDESGTFSFACGMDMIEGTIIVKQ